LRDLQHVLEVDLEARAVARSCVKEVEKLS
jgi:hypothetical protein